MEPLFELSLQLPATGSRELLRELHRQEREVLRQEQADVYKHEVSKFKLVVNWNDQ